MKIINTDLFWAVESPTRLRIKEAECGNWRNWPFLLTTPGSCSLLLVIAPLGRLRSRNGQLVKLKGSKLGGDPVIAVPRESETGFGTHRECSWVNRGSKNVPFPCIWLFAT